MTTSPRTWQGLAEVSEGSPPSRPTSRRAGSPTASITLVWSEFGRRPEANESNGTDHGAGGVAWVQGTRARGGVLSDYPSLNSFDGEDNLQVTLDFPLGLRVAPRRLARDGRRRGHPQRRCFRRLALVR
jgi:hypothetical protein